MPEVITKIWRRLNILRKRTQNVRKMATGNNLSDISMPDVIMAEVEYSL
jgi:hypothetical protein